MGSLNNLYISQSFQSLVHFGTDWTASANLIQLEDGLGNGLGVSLNTNGDISASGDITASNLYAPTISGSNGHFSNGLFVSGTISAYELKVVIESSSIIFTSGSNIIGDEANVDTQTLVGRIINTGSLEITGSTKTIGNITVTGSLDVSNNISSSTLSGVGNVTLYSASVFSQSVFVSSSLSNRIETNSASFALFSSSQYKADSSSFDSRLDTIEIWSQSISFNYATQAELNLSSSQLQANINTKLDTASFNSYSASAFSQSLFVSNSFVSSITNLSSSIYQTDATQSNNITINSQSAWGAFQSASAFSASAASASNAYSASAFSTFVKLNGGNTYSGSQILTGSLRGNVVTLSVTSNTASMNCSLGNFFTLTLQTGSNTFLSASNILPGETIQLRVIQPSVTGSLTLSSQFLLPTGSVYQASNFANKSDILSFVTFDTTSLYTVFVKTL